MSARLRISDEAHDAIATEERTSAPSAFDVRPRRFPSLVVLLLCFVFSTPYAIESRVIKVATWNVYGLPTIAGQAGEINMDDEDRGRLTARILKGSGYDVIALNEVFDEDIREGILEEAQSGSDAFQFVVQDLDAAGTLEDSGLLLLSRLNPTRFPALRPVPGQSEFNPDRSSDQVGYAVPFPGTDRYEDSQRCAQVEVWIRGQGLVDAHNSVGCLVAFHRFRACTDETPDGEPVGSECDSGKGVGFVRLVQPDGRPLDVFWSHMQANLEPPFYEDPPDFVGPRSVQLRELVAVVKQWSGTSSNDAVILGDLNINGFGAPPSPSEYATLLAAGGGSALGQLGFTDVWARDSSPEDLGASYSTRNDHIEAGTEQRLDYLLWRQAPGRDICGQHPRVERHFDWSKPNGTTVDLSDHFGIGSEFRSVRITDPCSPARARKVQDLPDGVLFGDLSIPGACQWVRIEEGTWAYRNMSAFEVHVTAHPASDISETLAPFRGDGTLAAGREHGGEGQVASDSPFYLKVCWREPKRWGSFRIRIAPNVGQDPDHPIVLSLNRWKSATFGQEYGSNPTTRLWGLVQLPATFSGNPHILDIDRGGHSVKLRYGTALTATDPPKWHSPFDFEAALLRAGTFGFGGPTATEVFVLIEREVPVNPSIEVPFSLRMVSDHHRVELGALSCHEQEDSTGDDRIRMTYVADGKTLPIVDLGAFDEKQDVNLSTHPQLGVNWVTGPVQVSIYDQDGEDLDGDVLSGNALDHLGTQIIPDFMGPSSGMPEVSPAATRFNLDDADYRLKYTRSR